MSLPRLQVAGSLNGRDVTGLAWMDHEWFTHQLAPEQAGWDWFSVQLENHTELMLFRLRRRDGSVDPYSAGTFVDAAGGARHLRATGFTLEPLEYWTSPRTKARYPVRWRVRVPRPGAGPGMPRGAGGAGTGRRGGTHLLGGGRSSTPDRRAGRDTWK